MEVICFDWVGGEGATMALPTECTEAPLILPPPFYSSSNALTQVRGQQSWTHLSRCERGYHLRGGFKLSTSSLALHWNIVVIATPPTDLVPFAPPRCSLFLWRLFPAVNKHVLSMVWASYLYSTDNVQQFQIQSPPTGRGLLLECVAFVLQEKNKKTTAKKKNINT